jgi:hypothetical protein
MTILHRTIAALLLVLVGPFLCCTVSSAHPSSEVPFALAVSMNERVFSCHRSGGRLAFARVKRRVTHHQTFHTMNQSSLTNKSCFEMQEEEEHHHHHHHGRSVQTAVGTVHAVALPS